MQTIKIPVSRRPITFLAFATLVPSWLTTRFIGYSPVAQALVALVILALLAAMYNCMMKRRTIELGTEAMRIRFYLSSLSVERSMVKSASFSEIASPDQIDLSYKKKGMTLPGYTSGWFKGSRGDVSYCAITQWPVQLMEITGHAQCQRVALSVSPDVIRQIQAWAAG